MAGGSSLEGFTVAIENGSNTNLIGSTISGQGVTEKVGNNLTVESLQDSRTYHETSKKQGNFYLWCKFYISIYD